MSKYSIETKIMAVQLYQCGLGVATIKKKMNESSIKVQKTANEQ